jgi:hypothetical protein
MFHPTRAGILVTLGSIVGMYAVSIWSATQKLPTVTAASKRYQDTGQLLLLADQ